MSCEIKGKLQSLLPEQTGQGRNGTWVKQSFVIETDRQYPKSVCLDAWGDSVDIIKSARTGAELTIQFDPESREYNGKWYTNLRAWSIKVSGATSQTVQVGQAAPPPPIAESGDDSDLPF